MGVKLRLARHGAKKNAYFRIVAADVRAPRDGRYIDHVGVYDPTTQPATIRLRPERIRHWLKMGAVPSTTVKNLLDSYLGTAETLAQENEFDPSSTIWVQGPDNSPASQHVPGTPANKTSAELTEIRKEARKAHLAAQKAAAPPEPEPVVEKKAPAPVKAAEEAPAEEAAEETPAEATAEEAPAEEAAEETPAEETAEEAPAEEAAEETPAEETAEEAPAEEAAEEAPAEEAAEEAPAEEAAEEAPAEEAAEEEAPAEEAAEEDGEQKED